VDDLRARERPAGVARLSRAAGDRGVPPAARSGWATVAAQPGEATATGPGPRRGPPPPRPATLAVRGWPRTRCPPRHRQRARRPTVPLGVVHARAEAPPAGPDPREGGWLTTGAVHTTAEARERLAWSACRWGGSLAEHFAQWRSPRSPPVGNGRAPPAGSAALERVAWRMFSATMRSRAVPEVPCPGLVEREAWPALSCAIPRTPLPPATPPSLRQAVHWLAQLGGCLARRGDGDPGATVVWTGFQHLTDLTPMYCIMRPAPLKRRKYG
jgi:Transposase Tn5 dimerisation domain